MKRNVDLLEGPIAGSLAKLAFPIMGTSLIQMAYNLVDMIWIGRISSNAVAAIGAAGMYMWLANGITTIPRMGGQVTVGQSLGLWTRTQPLTMPEVLFGWGHFLHSVWNYQCDFFRPVDRIF